MKFTDTAFSRTHRYALGIEEQSGRRYLSIPVSNGLVDYEEYYEISDAQYSALLVDEAVAARFAAECRAHRHDDLLMQQPGWNRGTAV
ncbi:hypothetical protein LK09_13090 [Microbacterium mangrovi]|uniref:Uncharacterized protein n=1 Tax=Microbacterium mangrovi TaxID=1348253 RepID=A0A0B2A6L5_9MICO|nr:hypothetical protein LK09_13090 [Microbacterium mangrovi]